MGRNEQNLFRSCSNTTVAEEEIRKKTKGIPEGRVSVYEATFGGQRRVFTRRRFERKQTVDEGADQSMFLHGREMMPTDTEQKQNQI